MKLLLTSDWQAEVSNLDNCEVALEEVSRHAVKNKVDAIIHGGDTKQHYDPLHTAVITFWVSAIKRIKASGIPFYILLGNHDRTSQGVVTRNWFPILRTAGAKVITKPTLEPIGDGLVSFLPFTASKQKEQEWVDQLVHNQDSNQSVLIFHTDVAGSVINAASGMVSESSVKIPFKHFRAGFGGHIHEHQQIRKNWYYIGSPFTHDWGEVNQQKGHLLYDNSTRAITQIKSSIPAWYDYSFLKENKITPEVGAIVRIKVPVTTKKITAQLTEAEETVLRRWPNVQVYPIPVVKESGDEQDISVSVDSSDEENVRQYALNVLPKEVRYSVPNLCSYMVSSLSKAGEKVYGRRIRLLSLQAKNVLVFKSVEVNLHRRGLVLLKAKNLDWPKRSNGSGKTSLLNLALIAAFGRTLKNQKNDTWATEANKETASVTLRFRDSQKRIIEITRTRRPHGLVLKVDGKNMSSGITGTRKGETQSLIENYLGFDYDLFVNSVFIDQTISNGFAFGTQKMRMDLISKLQNLQRYDAALKVVKQDIASAQDLHANLLTKKQVLISEIKNLRSDYQDIAPTQTDWAQREKHENAKMQKLTRRKDILASSTRSVHALQKQIDNLQAEYDMLLSNYNEHKTIAEFTHKELSRIQRLVATGKCPTCGQPTKEVFSNELTKAVNAHKDAFELVTTSKKRVAEYATLLADKESIIESFKEEERTVIRQIDVVRYALTQAIQGAKEEKERNAALAEKKKAIRIKIYSKKDDLQSVRSQLLDVQIKLEMLYAAKNAFSRSGMPLYLSAALCPVLNKVADEYAQIFNGGRLTVRFKIVDGEFEIDIINSAGSSKAIGQSTGEAAMAGIVTAFAIREVSSRVNVLLIDEPGHGLDEIGARDFARGLLQLKDKFETIIVTTHNSTIESELAGEKVWTVTKSKGTSTLSTI